MISIDALAKFVDSNQLIRDLGGSFPYDHDDWLDTRLVPTFSVLCTMCSFYIPLCSLGTRTVDLAGVRGHA